MLFVSRPKCGKDGIDRIVPPKQTIQRVAPFMESIGVTRIADITGLDSSGGIPVYSAVRPTDIGRRGISVYNGKGLTHAQAKAGAMMEAVERYCAETWDGPTVIGTLTEVASLASRSGARVLSPDQMRLHRVDERSYNDDPLEWIQGSDLLRHCPVYIPLNFVLLGYEGPLATVWFQSSNGLASGNCPEEAVSHALAEMIERDAYTMAVVRIDVAPRARALLDSVYGRPAGAETAPDHSASPFVDPRTLPSRLARIVGRLERSGVEVLLRLFPSDTGLPIFVALVKSQYGIDRSMYAGGFGCHVNAEVAAMRALTEAIQSRNAMIQGAREDIPQLLAGKHRFSAAARAATSPDPLLWGGDRRHSVVFAEIASRHHDDVLDDVQFMLNAIVAAGVSDVYAIDVSKPGIPASVVKVIVPEFEGWFLSDFDPDFCNLGPRAQVVLQNALK